MEFHDYDAALFDFQNALRRDPGNAKAAEGVKKATELQKEATHVDLYAILGVRSTASEAEIRDAYKLKVRQWHPDRFSDPQEKEAAEEMMTKVNSAFDVLGDANSRRIYDLGGDVDNAGQQGFDDHRFAHFFHAGPAGFQPHFQF
jgi:DnaJ-class molecular chaperone